MEETTITRSEKWRGRLRRLRSGVRKAIPFVSGILAAFLGLFLYNLVFPGPKPLSTQDVNDTVNNVLASATPMPAYSELVYQVIQPSLVLIQTKVAGKDGKEGNGLGSGVVVDDMGDILTALHVVDGASEIHVTFADGTQSTAQVTTTQPDHDIAVLKADSPPAKLYPATLGNPNAMQVGDEAYAFGNPFGLYGSMSAGIISGFDRSFQPANSPNKLTGLIQIDAAVNPGNSGGPLLNRYGQVIGIVEGIVNPTDQDVFIGIGFAVPINIAGGALGSPPD
jgi:S1-C subfamily serine protease